MVSFEVLDYYSGVFSVSSKPELPIVFIGSLIFIVGLISSFLTYAREFMQVRR